MLFPTIAFTVFFVVVYTANWLLRPHFTAWRAFMVAASFYFYCYWDWRFGFLLGGSAVANWLFGRAIGRSVAPVREEGPAPEDGAVLTATATTTSRSLVRLAVVVNLLVLAYFKYAGFFSSSVQSALDAMGVGADSPVFDVLLPVGISFTTFHAISYVVDVGRGRQEPLGLLDFTLYLSFFPHLVAGPIVRATEFAPQISTRPDPRNVRATEALWLIVAGLFKKVVISTYLAATIVDPVFAAPSEHSALEVLIGIYGYAIQIYADFSGYTDIAIGCALLLGFRFPQNFDAPYIARSVQDFWRRWHMTLSRWLRDYVYIPLGGSRVSPGRTSANLMATMLLGGLWHGSSWNFVIWGGIHGAALIGERRIKSSWRSMGLPPGVVAVLQWLLTMHIVCLAWVFFRARDLDAAWQILQRLWDGMGEPSPALSLVLLAVLGGCVASQFVPPAAVARVQVALSHWKPVWQGLAFGAALLVVDTWAPVGVAPFIYFQF